MVYGLGFRVYEGLEGALQKLDRGISMFAGSPYHIGRRYKGA